jgi:hypothetical protein
MEFKKLMGLVCLTALLVFLASGCSYLAREASEKAVEKAIEKESGGKADVDVEEGKVRIKTEEGEAEIEVGATELPDDFPSDFPLYENAKVSAVYRSEAGGKVRFNVTFELSDSWQEAKDFYQDELPKSGYTIAASSETQDGAMLYLKKGGEDAGLIAFGEGDGQDNFTVTLVK